MRNRPGFSLIELSIALVIVMILAAIAIPNLIHTVDQSRQGRTISDLRAINTALDRYAAEENRYPDVDDIKALRPMLQPRFIKKLPTRDGWRHPLVYEVDEGGLSYTLRSPGKDGEFASGPPAEIPQDFTADIVMVDGVFVQGPLREEE